MSQAFRIPRKNKKKPPIEILAAIIDDSFEWVALLIQYGKIGKNPNVTKQTKFTNPLITGDPY